MAAENVAASGVRLRPRRRRDARGFNEAAPHGRGKRHPKSDPTPAMRCFNEAAAHGRGKRATGVIGAAAKVAPGRLQ